MRSTLALCAAAAVLASAGHAGERRPMPPLPGKSFHSAVTQALEADDGANPGMLWVEQGAALWKRPAGGAARSCAGCHGDDAAAMRGVAARYPAVDGQSGELLNVERRINRCRTRHMQAPALGYESDELLSLTAFVAGLSRGLPRRVETGGAAAPFFARGRELFHTRQGQLDLACTQCHDGLVGRRMRGDVISQGQSDGWPAYRLEWNTLGSLHRRLRACSLGVRAEVLDYGSPEYLALELYLAWRGEGLPLSSPAVRR